MIDYEVITKKSGTCLYNNTRKEKTGKEPSSEMPLKQAGTEYNHASFNTPLKIHMNLSCLCQPEDLWWHPALSNTGLRLIRKGVCYLLRNHFLSNAPAVSVQPSIDLIKSHSVYET